MSSSVSFPNPWTFILSGGVRITPDPIIGDPTRPIGMQAMVFGDPARPVATMITGDPAKPVTATLQGNSAQPVAAAIELLNLPRMSLDNLKDLLTPKLRIQMPTYRQLCFKFLDMELFSLCLSGESQIITQPFKPNTFERCEVECCDEDTRPFPRDTRTHDVASNS